MFHHFTMNYIWLMHFLHELKQVLVLVKQFSFINRNVSIKQIILTWFIIFPISCLQMEESSKFTFSKHSGPLTQMWRCETQYLYHTDTFDMNESQSSSLPLLNFLSADLTWLGRYCTSDCLSCILAPSQWRNMIQPQQLMLWLQFSELAQ